MYGAERHIHIMINTLDMETFNDNNTVIPYCICFVLEDEIYMFYYKNENESLVIECLQKIYHKTKQKYVEFYIHNINFDGMLIIDELTKNKIFFSLKSRGTNLYYIDVIFMGITIKFRCSYKILPISLRSLGDYEKIGKSFFPYKFVNKKNLNYIGKIPDIFFWENINDHNEFSKNKNFFDLKNESLTYCKNDVLLLQKILKNILPIINNQYKYILNSTYSSASLSHKIFFKKYNNKNILEKISTKNELYIKNSYFGGRCEVFGNLLNNEHIKYFDFSGMYGQCMNESFHNGKASYYINSDYTLPGFHTILYNSENFDIPILPYHSETGKLIFTNGTKIGTFWFEEIKLFVENGGIVINTLNSYIYEKYEKTFDKFIDNFNEIKKKNGYYKLFGKLMINSLYGSMALKNENVFLYTTFSEKEFYYIIRNVNTKNFYNVNNVYFIYIINDYKSKNFFIDKNFNQEKSIRNISYASAISSKARIKLYNAIKDVIRDGGRILYCDTDSIFAAYPKNNQNTFFNQTEWLKFYSDGVFMAPKTYMLKNDIIEIKIKGVNTATHLSLDCYNDIKNKFYEDKFLLFDNQLNFKRSNFYLKQLYNSKKIFLNSYDKRIFIENKSKTKPLIINTDPYI